MRKIFILILFSSFVFAKILVIAASKDFFVNSLTKEEIISIYLEKRRIKGHKIVAVNFPPNHPLREVFEAKILKKRKKWLERYWLNAHYHGHRPPKVFKSKKAVILFVKRFSNAICYLYKEDAKKQGLKILYESDDR